MTQVLWVPGPLPGMNEIVAAAKGSGGTGRAYSRMKKEWTNTVALHARVCRLKPVPRCHLTFAWAEATRKRDPDNVVVARKFILDGLVVAGVLENDGWEQVTGWSDTWAVHPRCGVSVEIRSPEVVTP